jgi:hypothetical protein
MKQITAFLFLGFFLWQTAGTFMHYQLLTNQIRSKSQSFSSSSKRVLSMTLSKSDFCNLKWRNEKEFTYQSHLYDLISYSTKNKEVHLMVYQDEEEQQLEQQLSKHLNSSHKKENKSKNVVLEIIKILTFCDISILANPTFTESNLLKNETSYLSSNYDVSLKKEIQPPIDRL